MTNVEMRRTLLSQLASNSRLVERAIIVLYERQTADEQSSSTTVHHNGKGFSAWSAERGSYYARWIQSGKHLTGVHLQRARHIAQRHVRQLVELAQQKAASKEVAHTANAA
jgi:hypothetical protein